MHHYDLDIFLVYKDFSDEINCSIKEILKNLYNEMVNI